jgi:methylthioribose-1-phosphate isomerase
MRSFEQFAIRYTKDNELQIIDQTQLPDKELWITAKDYKDMGAFIKRLSVRGAPMIGVAAVRKGEKEKKTKRKKKNVFHPVI